MGMYDTVILKIECPVCNDILEEFQTKDLGNHLDMVDYRDLLNFYTQCPNCKAWIEFNRKQAQSLNDFTLTVRA
jgi:uncharacterized protein with PIN domain